MMPLHEPSRRSPEGVIVEAHVVFTLAALCRASGADAAEVQALVDEGLLLPAGDREAGWRFSGDALPRTLLALRLSRDLDLNPAGVALVMDLLAEIERLRSRVRSG